MKNVYENTKFLDDMVIDKFGLSSEILMENAASALEMVVCKYAKPNSMIIIVVGPGNNGGDGLALARRLIGTYNVKIFMPFGAKSRLCNFQLELLNKLNPVFIDKLFLCDIVVDCLFGLNIKDNGNYLDLISQMNNIARINIACDMPSGLFIDGSIKQDAFKADVMVSIGGLKLAYFSDIAKDYIGEIVEANVGVSKHNYEIDSKYKLLDNNDCKLPIRNNSNVHKGSFGHCCIIAGEREGASIISALSAFSFGCGLVSIIGEVSNIPCHIMNGNSLPNRCNSVVFGMGLGNRINKYNFDFLGDIPSVIDADMFYNQELSSMLNKGNIVLTPHLKEFTSLLKILDIGDFDIDYVSSNRINLLLAFSDIYPNIVLLLKGANSIVVYNKCIYINTLGKNNLSKGGSGDVLSGMIGSLISQNYSLFDATISASLAHSIASNNIKTSYGLDPLMLIESVKFL